jgi:ferritin-like metal-binding protein YciE
VAKSAPEWRGLIEEGKELIEEEEAGPTLDAAMICAAQKVEHYEIAAYGCLMTYARLLEMQDAVELLQETLAEEKETDEKLTAIASELNLLAEVEAE